MILEKLWRDRDGAVMVEAAIVTPFLIALSFGAFEFANMFFAHQLVTQNVRDAARYLARTDDPANTTTAFNLATRKGPGMTCPPVTNCILPWFNPSQLTASVTQVDNPVDANGMKLYRGGETIPVVTVTAIVTYPGMGFFQAIGITQQAQFAVRHSERVIGE